MAKPRSSRKSLRRTRRKASKKQRKSQRKLRGGNCELRGAPLSYSLADGWSSKMSLNQGTDYFKYHADQHGGALEGGPFPGAVDGTPFLSGPAVASARVQGLNDAIAYSAQFKDPYPAALDGNQIATAGITPQKGGRKRRSSKKSKKSKKAHKHGKRRCTKNHRRRGMRGGGMPALGFDTVTANGLLLPNKQMYDNAGLNPEFRGAAAEYMDAAARDAIQ